MTQEVETVETLRARVAELANRLRVIADCTDKRCSLCAACHAAATADSRRQGWNYHPWKSER